MLHLQHEHRLKRVFPLQQTQHQQSFHLLYRFGQLPPHAFGADFPSASTLDCGICFLSSLCHLMVTSKFASPPTEAMNAPTSVLSLMPNLSSISSAGVVSPRRIR